ncbi:MAG: hypothetical protein R2728_13705 [Chitinophagales bacterium]
MERLNINISSQQIHKWFRANGFKLVKFENGKTYIASYYNGGFTSVKLKEKPGFDTFYKEAYGSAIIVYDVCVDDGILIYEGYCPIWLFGLWLKKVSFKKSANGIFQYRREGFFVEEKFQQFLSSKLS